MEEHASLERKREENLIWEKEFNNWTYRSINALQAHKWIEQRLQKYQTNFSRLWEPKIQPLR